MILAQPTSKEGVENERPFAQTDHQPSLATALWLPVSVAIGVLHVLCAASSLTASDNRREIIAFPQPMPSNINQQTAK